MVFVRMLLTVTLPSSSDFSFAFVSKKFFEKAGLSRPELIGGVERKFGPYFATPWLHSKHQAYGGYIPSSKFRDSFAILDSNLQNGTGANSSKYTFDREENPLILETS